jgi:uncharacterized membrane protein
LLHKIGSFLLLTHRAGSSRYWEIDVLRAVAIINMVIYHLSYDLRFLGYTQTNVTVGAWRAYQQMIATSFISLAGIVLAVSYARASRRAGGWDLYKTYLARGLKLIGWGMVITLVTGIYMEQLVVVIGILHLIGAATILSIPFLALRPADTRLHSALYLGLGVALIGLGSYLNGVPVTYPWLLVFGLRPPTLFQFDYFPLLPWFGVSLLGVLAGQVLYPGGVRRFELPAWGERAGVKQLGWLGRHSLAIYLIHQPILFGIFFLIGLLGGATN